ncbi:MAG TPA: alpha/beta hydrolase-fold protein [Candidatus Acidoferrales bacterium]|nr:alpha/beta hydrolase-fold protein [Candidatus Acidoferrales bacterium]
MRIHSLLGLFLFASAAFPQHFEVSFAPTAHDGPITGRVFVAISKKDSPPLLHQIGSWTGQAPFFGVDVEQLAPGTPAAIDASVLGYPAKSLKDIPAGEYYVQALVNVYTRFARADGHTIWAHMDQWEGQHFNNSPGNLFSEVRRVRLDPGSNYIIKLEANQVIPPMQSPAATEWVKRVKIQSPMLSRFWGHPVYLGATVLLPKGYTEHPNERYPVIYSQGHFGLNAPLGFAPGNDFYKAWTADDFPRMIAVTWQHPTPYFDDSYAVNSANNGPYGDALLKELVPYLEEHFRMVREPWARLLTGGSTGGWESLALQLYHPDFFGGTWTFFPDPIDFRRYQLVNIYEDPNAFETPGYEFMVPERPMMRTAEGQMVQTMRQMNQLEEVLGSHGRSTQQFEAWEAVYGPAGEDGYPKPLWDKRTGKIDRAVANYMRDHGYDLAEYTKRNWEKMGPQLKGKLHLYCGDMDNFYLNLAVYLFEDYMKTTGAGATFDYGRPMKGHGWHPMNNAELVKMMAAQIAAMRPATRTPAPAVR